MILESWKARACYLCALPSNVVSMEVAVHSAMNLSSELCMHDRAMLRFSFLVIPSLDSKHPNAP